MCAFRSGILVHTGAGNGVFKGFDLALVYFEQPISPAATAYEVVSSTQNDWRFFVKFGFGCHGYGGTGVDVTDVDNPAVYDHTKRWAANMWDSPGLGTHGVRVCGTTFTNNHTQRVYDFDNFTQITNNLFNFYMHTFDPSTGWIEVDNHFYSWGVWGAEGWACNGDSGGPNFVFDEVAQQWKIAAVTSYVYRMDDDSTTAPDFPGNPDIDGPTGAFDCGKNISFGEFGGDAVVHDAFIADMLEQFSAKK